MKQYEKLQSWRLDRLEAENKRYISMLSDYGFKATYGNPSDTSFLRKAIQVLIKSEVPITEVTLDRNEVEGLTEISRGGVFDVSCRDAKGNSYVVEMQLSGFRNFLLRARFYGLHRFSQMLPKGKFDMKEVRKMIVISFLGGRTLSGKDYYHLCAMRDEKGKEIDDLIRHVIVELGKWDKFHIEPDNDLEKLIYVMKFTDVATPNTPMAAFMQEDWVQKILRELELRSLTPEQRFQYEKYLLQEMSQILEFEEELAEEKKAKERAIALAKIAEAKADKAISQAEKERIKTEQKKEATIIKLLQMSSMDANQIATAFEMPLAEVKKIQLKIQKNK